GLPKDARTTFSGPGGTFGPDGTSELSYGTCSAALARDKHPHQIRLPCFRIRIGHQLLQTVPTQAEDDSQPVSGESSEIAPTPASTIQQCAVIPPAAYFQCENARFR